MRHQQADPARENRVAIGRIVRAHGIRGEVVIDPLTELEARFAVGAALTMAVSPDAEGVAVVVTESRLHKGRPLLRLDRIEDRTHAEHRVGSLLFITREQALAEKAEGEFFLHELVGRGVRSIAGASLGSVVGIIESNGPALLEIEADDGRRRMLPFVHAFVREVEDDGLVVDPPVGWEDL